MKNDLLYYLSFSHFLGIGPIKMASIMAVRGSIKRAYETDQKELETIIGVKLAQRFINFREKFDPIKKHEELTRKNIKIISIADKNYPTSLKQISDPPICIYVKGGLNSLTQFTLAIVGTRSPTVYGQQVAYKFSRELAEAGFTIVSGMALGIDAVAHRATLDAQRKTIAVLGCGVDIIYPAANRSLYEKIIENGAVISEFPPGHMVIKGLFIARNRIISALSSGVLVIEGGERSGALITAKYAAEQGKEVFAVPSAITSNMSSAPNILIKQGAKLVTSTTDIFEELNIKITPNKNDDIESKLNEDEKIIYLFLKENSSTVNEIIVSLNKPTSEILNILSILEIKGIIEKNNENKYQITL
ncbi:MAG: protecting protein DprA protein [Candidatus Roizmanbacteria bacterium GW2011_GWA2_35_8]|uniref:Protecting protein DprA protein n=1 Tax=Candidatus Roizmanbacteria bacterium GW2011_GWA2_35_8 TaxID=1618479 RepID=A0A0G0DEI5_9BACT|nr:MAG: protecting protein DprA protein [Candidatus Roizmanbacteria bacterium GW2011_GWA2_35_8]